MASVIRNYWDEVTKSAVKAAIKNPRKIDMNLVNSQQTRRILDRILGYKLSPLLWKNVKSGLSAGRVQSVATKIIVEREEEIQKFVPEEYWTIETQLTGPDSKTFRVHFVGTEEGKMALSNEAEAKAVAEAVNGKPYTVASVRRASKQKNPAAPFTTSSLQQEAFRKLGFQSQRTMKVAQELYEGINLGSEFGGTQGLITYMRTDSVRVSADAQNAARDFIMTKYGAQYCPEVARVYKSRAGAQDAHEAIRPSRVDLEPAMIRRQLTPDQFKLYKLIWECFIASQMESATLNTISIDLNAAGYLFRTSGYSVAFQGYMAVYEATEETNANDNEPKAIKDIRLPELETGNELTADDAELTQHFTEPPVRYNDASLIKMLKDLDIGRPSTYATIISTIITRNYVKREGKAFVPTPLGTITNQLMEQNFKTIVDYGFTAEMERDLDKIEEGDAEMLEVLKKFWADFSTQLEEAEKNIGQKSIEIPPEETDIICDKCGSRMIVRNGRFGKFAACPNYPTCRNTKPLTPPEAEKPEEVEVVPEEEVKEPAKKAPVIADFKCEKCGGDMVLRTGKFGSFYACARYPECRFTKARVREVGAKCPKCEAKIVTKYGRNRTVFYSCERYPECDFSSWDVPTNELCPDCGKMLFRKKGKSLLVCHDEDCKYSREIPAGAKEQGEE